MLQIVSILFGLMLGGPSPIAVQQIPLQEWVVQRNDRFIVDTQSNMGYLVHESGNYTSFKVGSGQRKTVRYIGKTYNAATPSKYWEVQSTAVFGDKGTFGKSGRFMRLYMDGELETSYGIHATGNIDEILASDVDGRYKSMGCVLVGDDVLDILYKTYELNGKMLQVATAEGLPAGML